MDQKLKDTWPWATEFERHLRKVRGQPLPGGHLVLGSDYSGDHSGSRFRVYGFVIANADALGDWLARSREVRQSFLPSGRRMAFKKLNDGHKRRALVPFLESAEFIEGHVVGVVVTKEMAHLCTTTGTMELWQRVRPLQARWDAKTFEQMVRVTHFFSLLLAAWSSPQMKVSWISDDDQTVANPERLDDARQFATRMTTLYVPHRLGEFIMNTVAIDGPNRELEDFLAIPDLAAGMLSELVSAPSTTPAVPRTRLFTTEKLSPKSETIADWFWHSPGSLKKTCILIDSVGDGLFRIAELKRDS